MNKKTQKTPLFGRVFCIRNGIESREEPTHRKSSPNGLVFFVCVEDRQEMKRGRGRKTRLFGCVFHVRNGIGSGEEPIHKKNGQNSHIFLVWMGMSGGWGRRKG